MSVTRECLAAAGDVRHEGTIVSTNIVHPRGDTFAVLPTNRKATARAVSALTGCSYQAAINRVDTETLEQFAAQAGVSWWRMCDVIASVNSPDAADINAVQALLEALVPAVSWGVDHNWWLHGTLAGAAAPADGSYLWAVADDELSDEEPGDGAYLVRVVRSEDQLAWRVVERRSVPLRDTDHRPLMPGAAVGPPGGAAFGATDTRLSFSLTPSWDEVHFWIHGLGYPYDARPTGLSSDEPDPLRVARRVAEFVTPQLAPAVFCWPIQHAGSDAYFHVQTFDLTCEHDWQTVTPPGTNPPHERLACRRCRWAERRRPLT